MPFIVKILSTFFYVGYIPLIPGTVASLITLGIFILIGNNLLLYWLLTVAVLLIGFLVTGPAEGIFRKKDPRPVVIDEVAGMLLSLAFLPGLNYPGLFLAFLLFRIFDWFKPYPIKEVQKFSGSLGIMLDDILAAVYANIILQVFLRYASCRIS